MAKGLLKINGKIAVNQFWPEGSSDADTTKILVDVEDDSFLFRPHSGAKFRPTRAFHGARVRSKAGSKLAIDGKNRITVRLQGVDAPELHYRPQAARRRKGPHDPEYDAYLKLNEEYRQHWAEAAAMRLGSFLSQAKQDADGRIACTFVTAVDHPNDVLDMYARFVGDILVRVKKPVNVNRWLLQEGLAVPAFYTSMSEEEIETLTHDSKKPSKTRRGIWPMQASVGTLDRTLVYRKGKPGMSPAPKTGPVLFPKLFRRLSTWDINHDANLVTKPFLAYLEEHRDGCFETPDFLQNGPTSSTPRFLHEFIAADGTINFQPADLVFQEKASTLIGANGKPVTTW